MNEFFTTEPTISTKSTISTIVLDIDRTLVYALPKFDAIEHPDWCTSFSTFSYEQYIIVKRPYLSEFLSFCSSHFKIGIFSAGSEYYCNSIIKECFQTIPIEFILHSDDVENCSSLLGTYKDLKYISISSP